jgi:hypothetical protein
MNQYQGYFIPQRFALIVYTHLVRNLQHEPPSFAPLLLGIHGRPGDGKTFQLRRVLEDCGVHVNLLSGGQLESSDAGEPGARVRDAYLEASSAISNGVPACVVLNDADAAIGNWGSLTQYTVNTQNVITELMHLCDYPLTVENKNTRRVPIFLTGNDFTRLYGPLRRRGRMELFLWEMSQAERGRIVASLFPEIEQQEINRLLEEYPDHSVADWTAVAAQIDNSNLHKFLASTDVRRLLTQIIRGGKFEGGRKRLTTSEIQDALHYLEQNRSADLLSTDA